MSVNALHLSHEISREAAAPQFPHIEQVTCPAVPTNQAAHYINRRPNTLRIWAMRENGPIRPKRINGRLAWSVTDIKALMGV